MKRLMIAVQCLCALLIAIGCSSCQTAQKVDEQSNLKVDTAPVTLTFFKSASSVQLSQDQFDQVVAEPVKKKYPNITLQYIQNTQLSQLVSTNQSPDIILGSYGDFTDLKQLNILDDLTSLIQKFNFDVRRLDPSAIDSVKAYSDGKGFLFMPYAINGAALYYNKDIFDKFGVQYPKDHLTWDQAIQLARNLSRTTDDVQYRGLDINSNYFLQNSQLSAPFFDSQSKTAMLANPLWAKWLLTLQTMYNSAGNLPPDNQFSTSNNDFFKSKTVAMLISNNITSQLAASDLNWDMVTIPTFPDAGSTGAMLNALFYGISTSCSHKDQAFEALSALLSDDVQMENAANGILPVLRADDVKKQFGSSLPGLKGKNIAAFYELPSAKPRAVSVYDSIIRSTLSAEVKIVVYGKKDINTALNDAEDQANKMIESQKNEFQ